jgi:Tol biopolymer transport system component
LIGSDTSATVADDYLLFVRDGALVAQRFDADGKRAVGEPQSIVPQVAASPNFRSAVTASATGTLVYTPAQAGDVTKLVRYDTAGAELETIGTPARYRNPAISSDGRYLAVQQYHDSLSEIRLFDLTRGGDARLRHAANAEFPVWASDGRLAFAASDSGWLDLFVARVDADAPAESVFRSPADKMPTDWSPDGRYLCFTSLQPGGSYDLFALQVPVTAPPLAISTTTAEEADGQFSPDGHRIAFVSTTTGRPEVFVKQFPFGQTLRRVSVSGGMSPVWGPDGRLYYLDLAARIMRAEVPPAENATIPPPSVVMQAKVITAGTSRTNFALTPAGQLVVTTPTSQDRSASIAVAANWRALLGNR